MAQLSNLIVLCCEAPRTSVKEVLVHAVLKSRALFERKIHGKHDSQRPPRNSGPRHGKQPAITEQFGSMMMKIKFFDWESVYVEKQPNLKICRALTDSIISISMRINDLLCTGIDNP